MKFLDRLDSLPCAVHCQRAGFIALALVQAGCAATPPLLRPPSGHALAPQAESPFAPIESRIRARHDEQTSGFLLLPRNEDALPWRLALIDSARNLMQRLEDLDFKLLPPDLY